jgi:hypothetical protein
MLTSAFSLKALLNKALVQFFTIFEEAANSLQVHISPGQAALSGLVGTGAHPKGLKIGVPP